jgi:hypothetical protein
MRSSIAPRSMMRTKHADLCGLIGRECLDQPGQGTHGLLVKIVGSEANARRARSGRGASA